MPTDDRPLGEVVAEYAKAAFPGVWVHSYEHEEAIKEIVDWVHVDIPLIYIWDAVDGVKEVIGITSTGLELKVPDGEDGKPIDAALAPPAAMAFFSECNIEPGVAKPHSCVIILKNLHAFLNGQMLQLMQNYLARAKKTHQRIIVLSVESDIHKDLRKSFQLITHSLPDVAQLRGILEAIDTGEGELPEADEDVTAIVNAARGMTRNEAEDSFSLCLVRDGRISARPVFEVKAKVLKESGLGLELLHGDETFDSIGGLQNLKNFATDMLANRSDNPLLIPKGIILAGVPGTGKSLFAKALGNTLHPQRPTIRWDMGLTMSKWVGESQHNMRRCLDTADAMSPCNLFADEFEKQIATGTGGSATAGGDIQTQMLGQWLTWHQEHVTDVYVLLTMNNIMAIAHTMPEFLARFDEVFFLDFPAKSQKEEIWKIHLWRYGHIKSPEEFADVALPNDHHWTGRDIEKCCRQSAQRRKPLESIKIGTLSTQVSESIAAMREFASGRWMSVEYDDYYDKDEHQKHATVEKASTNRRDVRKSKSRPATV